LKNETNDNIARS